MNLRQKPIKRTPLKKRKRPAAKTNRIYGPPARRRFVTGLPCAACGIEGFTEQAHCAPPFEKGTGYKADYRFIVPLCGASYRSDTPGCHTLYDRYRSTFDSRFPDFNSEVSAAETEKAFQEYLEEKK